MAKRQKEGFRVKDVTPFGTFIPYIMVERSDSQNTITDFFEIAPAEKLIKEMRAEGLDSFGVMHVILAAYVRMVSQRPRTNRFIRGQKIWARNDIAVSLTIKRKMALDGEDTTVKMHFQPDYDIYDVYKEVNTSIDDFTEDGEPFKKRVIDIVVNIDERTTDGYYWASSLKYFKSFMAHPEVLKSKPETVVKDW